MCLHHQEAARHLAEATCVARFEGPRRKWKHRGCRCSSCRAVNTEGVSACTGRVTRMMMLLICVCVCVCVWVCVWSSEGDEERQLAQPWRPPLPAVKSPVDPWERRESLSVHSLLSPANSCVRSLPVPTHTHTHTHSKAALAAELSGGGGV